ncbi:efflux RND transporter periplasmic adaptor subunit [Methylosinus sp. Ce-a6]|uniref:efflux RND transporter periplasmic adaptor subunit n=1 Tax=Methylosinus sp. Ce-a6 TaxID=2172005 RepID=UPI001FCE6254|nr:efflux RND transporter periplasmic adaptor subunit [Methylosinus sp. Ce-a6]
MRDLAHILRRLAAPNVVPTDAGERRSSFAPFSNYSSLARMRLLRYGAALLASAMLGSLFPQISAPIRALFAAGEKAGDASVVKAAEGLVKLSAEQIEAAKIAIVAAAPGVLTRAVVAPAVVAVDPDRIGRVAAKVAGAVAELRKKLGDPVEKGEVIAVIESREVADAKSDYLAAKVGLDLQSALFQREKGLFEKKISAEQSFLKARGAYEEAKLRVDLARQKLAALDLSEAEIAALPSQPVGELRRKEIRAPSSGKVIERRADLGQPVGGEGQTKELFVIADISTVFAEIAVALADLPLVREGQSVRLSHTDEDEAEGRVVFIGPMLDHETHSGRAVASFANADFALRPGTAMTAHIALEEKPARLRLPRSALLTFEGETVVFVRAPEGFVKRKVETGASDSESIEIVSGLEAGEQVAATNAFVLKAELGKSRLEGLD